MWISGGASGHHNESDHAFNDWVFELTPEEDGVPCGYPFRDWDWLRVELMEGSALGHDLLQQNLDS